MIKIIKLIFVLLIVASIIVGYFYFVNPNRTISVGKGKVSKIETMVQLCTIDLYNEVPILDTINNKAICAIQKQKGSVSFDLEKMKMDTNGNTVIITLSPEIVEIFEATEDKSWEVVDTKSIGTISSLLPNSDRLTEEEENMVKSKVKRNSTKLLYHNGVIERARLEGAQNIKQLMEQVYRKPIKVIDPTPKGAHYNEYE